MKHNQIFLLLTTCIFSFFINAGHSQSKLSKLLKKNQERPIKSDPKKQLSKPDESPIANEESQYDSSSDDSLTSLSFDESASSSDVIVKALENQEASTKNDHQNGSSKLDEFESTTDELNDDSLYYDYLTSLNFEENVSNYAVIVQLLENQEGSTKNDHQNGSSKLDEFKRATDEFDDDFLYPDTDFDDYDSNCDANDLKFGAHNSNSNAINLSPGVDDELFPLNGSILSLPNEILIKILRYAFFDAKIAHQSSDIYDAIKKYYSLKEVFLTCRHFQSLSIEFDKSIEFYRNSFKEYFLKSYGKHGFYPMKEPNLWCINEKVGRKIALFLKSACQNDSDILFFILQENGKKIKKKSAIKKTNTESEKEFKHRKEAEHQRNIKGKQELESLLPKLILLLVFYGIDINKQNEYGETALIWASYFGKIEIIKTLMAFKVDVNLQTFNRKSTALILAAEGGFDQIVKILLANGANVDIQNREGDTALIFASVEDYSEVVKELIGARANINIQNNQGNTALIEAVKENNQQMIELLLQLEADTLIYNNEGDIAYSCAFNEQHPQAIKAILRHTPKDIKLEWYCKNLKNREQIDLGKQN